MIKKSIYYPAAMFRQYGDGIVEMISGNTSAKQAVERCERRWQLEFYSALAGRADGRPLDKLDAFFESVREKEENRQEETDDGAPEDDGRFAMISALIDSGRAGADTDSEDESGPEK